MERVLIVDDEPLLRQGLIEMFPWEAEGYRVCGQASNGAEALSLIERDVPDIVVTDVRMPVMDGMALASALRERFPSVRTIILSSYPDFDYVRQTLLQGAVDYLLKPKLNREALHTALLRARLARGAARPLSEDEAFYASCGIRSEGTAALPAIPGLDMAAVFDLIERTHLQEAARRFQEAVSQAVSAGCYPSVAVTRTAYIDVYGGLFMHAAWLGAAPQAEALRKAGECQLREAPHWHALVERFARLSAEAEGFLLDTIRQQLGRVLGRVWRHLWACYDQDLNLADIAEGFFVNKSYLCQLFSRHCHMSFGSLLGEIRMHKARQLLLGKDVSVQQVAKQVGYASPGYFARQFRKLTGCTPSEYQASHGQGRAGSL